jgi:hypothetical protein
MAAHMGASSNDSCDSLRGAEATVGSTLALLLLAVRVALDLTCVWAALVSDLKLNDSPDAAAAVVFSELSELVEDEVVEGESDEEWWSARDVDTLGNA